MKESYTNVEQDAIDWFKATINTDEDFVITKLDTLVNIDGDIPVPDKLRGVFTYENTTPGFIGSKPTGVNVRTAVAISYSNTNDVIDAGNAVEGGVTLYTDTPVPRMVVHPKFLLNDGVMDDDHPRNVTIRTVIGSSEEANGDWVEIHSIGPVSDDRPATAWNSYEIKLTRIKDEAALLRWLHHLLCKGWFTPRLATGFIEAVCNHNGWAYHGGD